jgi:hypothetical protein
VAVLARWQPGKNVSASKARVGPKSAKQGGSKIPFLRRRDARCLPEKISSGCVADRRVKIVPIEGYRLSFIEAVDYLACAHPILFRFAKVITERLAREQTLAHAEEHNVCRVVELERQIGMMNEVDPQQIRHRLVIALPG